MLTSATWALAAALAASPAVDVRSYWSDGHAELDGYQVRRERYGELRNGRMVMIFVKEPFSESARVKADTGRHPDSDVFDVMKLNLVEDFQTGIYDYNLMTSAFAAFDARGGRRPGELTKLTFAAQEWCGMMFEELLFDPQQIRQKRFSYFDGEGDQTNTLPRPADGITADELFFVVRSIPAPLLAPGEKKQIQLLSSLMEARLLHRSLDWKPATLSRSKDSRKIEVPAGSFEVETWTVEIEAGGKNQFLVERAHPHRIVVWNGPMQIEAKLAGSARLKYWELQREGHEKMLPQIGLR
jgi:hypothetical protein